jgi:hypothetical protein
VDYVTALLVDDPHLWLRTLCDELEDLGYAMSYQTLNRQVRDRKLRPPCQACLTATERPNAIIEHPPGEETQWDWVDLPNPPASWVSGNDIDGPGVEGTSTNNSGVYGSNAVRAQACMDRVSIPVRRSRGSASPRLRAFKGYSERGTGIAATSEFGNALSATVKDGIFVIRTSVAPTQDVRIAYLIID